MNIFEHIDPDKMMALLICSLLLMPQWAMTFLTRKQLPITRTHRQHRRRSPKARALSAQQMSKIDAAVASVITRGEPSGNLYAMDCPECGQERARPAEHAQLWPGQAGGWKVLMQCRVCQRVLVSRPLTRAEAEVAADMNVQLIQDLHRATS